MLFGLITTIEEMKTHGVPRNPRFERESRLWLIGKACARCGGKDKVQCHHIEPFHLHHYWPSRFPIDREMDPANWLPLCMGDWRCHLEAGHAGDFSMWVPDVAANCLAEAKRIADARKRLKEMPFREMEVG